MNNGNEFLVYYPKWFKASVVIGYPLMTVVATWFLLKPFTENDLTTEQKYLFPILGISALYQCSVGFRCFKYLKSNIIFNDWGLDHYHNQVMDEYNWDELDVKHYSFATTTAIKTKEGRTIGHFFNGIPNLALLVDIIENENNITYK